MLKHLHYFHLARAGLSSSIQLPMYQQEYVKDEEKCLSFTSVGVRALVAYLWVFHWAFMSEDLTIWLIYLFLIEQDPFS